MFSSRKVKTKVKNVDKDVLQVDTSYPGLIPQVKTPGSTKWVNIAKVTDVSKVPHKDFEMRTRFVFLLVIPSMELLYDNISALS